ncbi:hypothetical protein NG825_16830 [Xanthomonas sacchari]|nr:hypothetical protein NG825_16830 [Xanthomonas sacchari]
MLLAEATIPDRAALFDCMRGLCDHRLHALTWMESLGDAPTCCTHAAAATRRQHCMDCCAHACRRCGGRCGDTGASAAAYPIRTGQRPAW